MKAKNLKNLRRKSQQKILTLTAHMRDQQRIWKANQSADDLAENPGEYKIHKGAEKKFAKEASLPNILPPQSSCTDWNPPPANQSIPPLQSFLAGSVL